MVLRSIFQQNRVQLYRMECSSVLNIVVLLQAYKDFKYWGKRMVDLVVDLVEYMEAHPPPQHTMGSHLMRCTYPKTGED